MGEETDIVEPKSSEDVVAAEEVAANEPSKDQRRKRKKQLHKSLRDLMEFYLGDVNLSKDRFMSQHIQGQPFVYIDLSMFLTFNKVRALTSKVEDLAKALSHSEILQVSEDGTQVCRKTPIRRKENEDECTIYVEQLGPDVDHELLTKVFSEYGAVDYVSLPRFSHNGKFKGFAFVEFKESESAKKALEAFNTKGCCLSPHMAPEELMSIKNFDPNKENKTDVKVGEASHSKKGDTNESELERKQLCKEENSGSKCESANLENVSFSEKDIDKKEKKKRKFGSEEHDLSSHKRLKSAEIEEEQSDCVERNIPRKKEKHTVKDEKELSVCSLATEQQGDCKGNSEFEAVSESKNKVKKKVKTSAPEKLLKQSDSSTAKVTEEEKFQTKGKRKYSADDEVTGMAAKSNDDSNEPSSKKLKIDSEDGADTESCEPEGDEDEDETGNLKKKRKKRKKVKKEKSSAISLGLKILSKREWKQLRNRYLNMQRDMMRNLKQQLSYSKSRPVQEESVTTDQDDEKVKPGTVVKVMLTEPVTNCKTAKSDMRVHPEIRYIDVTEGSTAVYLRTATPDLAAALVQAQHWPSMQVIHGDEERDYWNKMKMDREEHFKKNKPNQRGRTKLLKRAERFQGKHITTFESS